MNQLRAVGSADKGCAVPARTHPNLVSSQVGIAIGLPGQNEVCGPAIDDERLDIFRRSKLSDNGLSNCGCRSKLIGRPHCSNSKHIITGLSLTNLGVIGCGFGQVDGVAAIDAIGHLILDCTEYLLPANLNQYEGFALNPIKTLRDLQA